MKTKLLLALAVLTGLLVAGSPPLGAQTTTTHNVYFIEDGLPGDRVPGATGEVVREEDGLSVIINTRHLPKGPFTTWLFFFTCDPFNDPDCAPTTGGPLFGTSDIVGSNGRAHLAIGVGEGSDHLTDAETDEVHAVIVSLKPDSVPLWERLTTPADGPGVQVMIAPLVD